MLKDGDADSLADVLLGVSSGRKKPKPGQLQALDMVMDRTEGKPVHSVNATIGVDQETANLVAELLKISATKE